MQKQLLFTKTYPMKKILSIFVLVLFCLLNSVKSQTMYNSTLTYLPNDSVRLNTSAAWSCSPSTCPTLNSGHIQVIGDTIHVFLYYNSFPCIPFFCSTLDTFELGVIHPNTLKAVKLEPATVDLINPPNSWDTSYSMSEQLILTFLWSGINNVNVKNFSINPNPAQEEIVIEYTLPGEAILTDITGRRLSNYTLPAGKNKETINISSLANGIYLVHYKRSDGMIATQKIVKQ